MLSNLLPTPSHINVVGACLQAANASLRRQQQEAQTQAGSAADLTTQVAQLQSALTTALDEADLLRSRGLAPTSADVPDGDAGQTQHDLVRCGIHAGLYINDGGTSLCLGLRASVAAEQLPTITKPVF